MKKIQLFPILFLTISFKAHSFDSSFASRIGGVLRKSFTFVGNHIFHPKDFSPSMIKRFTLLPFNNKIKVLKKNKLKTFLYPLITASNIYTSIWIGDYSLKETMETMNKENINKITFFLKTYFKTCVKLTKECFFVNNLKTLKDIHFGRLRKKETYSETEYFINPTVYFLHWLFTKNKS